MPNRSVYARHTVSHDGAVDKVIDKAVKLGARLLVPVRDQFWGDRTGTIVDPEGNTWMIATHIAELTLQEMKKKMAEIMKSQATTSRA